MSNELKAAVSTAIFTFIALFGASLIGWVQAVVDWSAAGGVDVFPDVSVLGKAAVAAAGAALTGLINFAVRWAQAQGVLPGRGPTYPGPGRRAA